MSDDLQRAEPIQRGFEYEVRLAVSIPLAWASLLKTSSKHHYDYKCRASGTSGTINGLYNTACDGEWASTLAVSWADLDLTAKVTEQLEHHTADHTLIREIRTWLHETKAAISRQHAICEKLHDPHGLQGVAMKEAPFPFRFVEVRGVRPARAGTRRRRRVGGSATEETAVRSRLEETAQRITSKVSP